MGTPGNGGWGLTLIGALEYRKIQGVVTINSPVEPSATGIKVFDRRKYALIA